MTISFSGLASGLDTSSWVESLVALKQAKVDTLEEEKETVLLSQETLNNIKSFFSSFRSVIEKVTDAKYSIPTMDIFAQNLANSSDTSVLTASATTEAEESTYEVLVDKLASNTQASSNYTYMTTIVQTTTATLNTKLINLGVQTGKIGVNVNGLEHGINIGESDTIGTFIEKMKEIGVDASFNTSTGIFSINIDANAINDIDGTGIVDAFHLEGVNEGYVSNNLAISKVDTIYSAATENTLLSELGVQSGEIVVAANDTSYTISIDENSTLGSFIQDLTGNGILAELDATGVFTITDAAIVDEGTTCILDALGLDVDIYGKIQTTGNLTHVTVTTEVTSATLDTLLKDLGDGIEITGGETIVVKDNDNNVSTITIDTTATLGELFDSLDKAGITASLRDDGTVEISGGVIEGGTFDLSGEFGLKVNAYNGMVTGNPLTETITEVTQADSGTRLVEDLGVQAGYIEIADTNGNIHYEKIYEGQAISNFIADLSSYGIKASLGNDGVLEIAGGSFTTLTDEQVNDLVTAGSILESNTEYIKGTDLLTRLYGAPVISTDQITVVSVYAKTQALTYSSVNTVNASKTTTLASLGLTTDGTAVFTIDNNDTRTIDIDGTMSIEDLLTSLQNSGITASWNSENSGITIEDAVLTGGTSDLADVLNLTTTVNQKYVTSTALSKQETIVSSATEDTLLSEFGITNTMSIEERTASIYDNNGNLVTSVILTENLSVGDLIDYINSSNTNASASISNGIFSIENGYIENSTLEAAMGLETSSKSSYVLGSVMTVTTAATIIDDTTLGEIISILGTQNAVSSGYSLRFDNEELNVSSSTTLGNLMQQIRDLGGTARFDSSGRLVISGGTVSGTVASALGITVRTATTGVTATGDVLYTQGTVYADRNSTFADLGVNKNLTYIVHDIDGATLKKLTIKSSDTIGEFLDTLEANDISGEIENGVISLDSLAGKYISGEVADFLGITSATTTKVVETTQSSTASITHTETIIADLTTKLGDINAITQDGQNILIYNSRQECIGTISGLTTSSTIGDMFNALSVYDISGTITDGIISLTSQSNNYASGVIMDNLGIIVTEGLATTVTIGQTVTSTAQITCTTLATATAGSTLGELGISDASQGFLAPVTQLTEAEAKAQGYTIIKTAQQLQSIKDDLSGKYILMSDIDLSGFNWTAIGDATNKFSGELNGNGYVVKNLQINKTSSDYQGLFGYIDRNSVIQNIGLENVNVKAKNYAGALVGYNFYGTISNSYTTGTVTAQTSYAGGIAGYNLGTIIESASSANVQAASYSGGITGANYGTISNSYITGSINGTNTVGGIAGANFNSIVDSFSSGIIKGTGSVGGIAGENWSSISDSLSISSVTGSNNTGGMVGINYDTISNSYAVGKVSGTSTYGGFAGNNSGTITNSGYNKDITGTSAAIGTGTNSGVEDKTIDAISSLYNSGSVGMIDNQILIRNGDNSLDSIFVNSDMTVRELFDALESYGISGTISDGIITFSSSNGGYLVGEVVSALGIDLISSNTVAVTTTSTMKVSCTTITTATLSTTLDYLGVQSESVAELSGLKAGADGFIKSVDRLTEAEAKAQGYTIIKTAADLKSISNDLDGKYILMNDVELSGVDWTAISNFAGELNGNGYSINNLTITKTSSNKQGLFASTAAGAEIKNLGLENVNIKGDSYTGALIGSVNASATISNVYVTGNIDGYYYVGGLIGYASSITIENTYSSADVNARYNSNSYAGGIIGRALYATISNSYTTGDVTAIGSVVGGIAGEIYYSKLSNSYALGNVSGKSSVGGLLGSAYATTNISNTYASGEVNGSANYVGGLIGSLSGNSNLSNSYASGDVRGSGYVGGLVGSASSVVNISNSHSTGSVNAIANNTGGFVGHAYNSVTITNSYATGDVTGASYTGGFAGSILDSATISDSYAIGNVSGAQYTGGFVGSANNTVNITNTYAAGDVSGGQYTGGFIGTLYHYGTIKNSYTSGHVEYIGNEQYGGAYAGYVANNSTITGGYYDNTDSGITKSVGSIYSTRTTPASASVSGVNTYETNNKINSIDVDNLAVKNGTKTVGIIQLSKDMTVEDLLKALEEYDIQGTIEDGVISLTSDSGNYVIGNIANKLGLYAVVEGDLNTTNGISSTSTLAITKTEMVYATGGTKLSDLGYVDSVTYYTASTTPSDFVEEVAKISESQAKELGYTVIKTADQLQSMSGSGKYILMNDINLSGYDWTAITDFRGELNGNGYVINNLTITTTANQQGLFATTRDGAVIKNLGLENVNVTGGNYTGALIGYGTEYTQISNVYVKGSVNGSNYTGGIVGHANSISVSSTYASADISGNQYVGGIIGRDYSDYAYISNSFVQGSISSVSDYAGGIIGSVGRGSISTSYSAAEVISNGDYTGGITGYAGVSVSISQTYVTGNITGRNYTGGIAGDMSYEADITQSYVTGNVSGNNYVGGIAGNMRGDTYTYTSFWDNTEQTGYNYAVIGDIYVTGNVTGEQYVGGLAGYSRIARITNGDFSGNLSGTTYVGGILGYSRDYTSLTNDVFLGNVTGDRYTGGIAGYADRSSFYSVVSSGTVIGGEKATTGGLVGYNDTGGSWSNSYALSYVNDGGALAGTISYDSTVTGTYDPDAVNVTSTRGASTGTCKATKTTTDKIVEALNDGTIYSPEDTIIIRNGAYTTGLIRINQDMTLDELCGELEKYGIKVELKNGELTFISPENTYIAGSYAAKLGITTSISGDSGTVGIASSSTLEVTYTEYAAANVNTTLKSLGAKDYTGFMADYEYISEEEAKKMGYVIVKTADDLKNIKNNLDARYILMNDIDLDGVNWEVINNFTGELNGNGYVIKNLTINNSTKDNQGLFGTIDSALIQNIGLQNVNVTGRTNVGGLVGLNDGTISNAYVIGSINGTDYVGGIVGSNSGKINNVYSAGSINADNMYAGGISGSNFDTITTAFSAATIEGKGVIGGISGDNWGLISKAYFSNSLTGSSTVGALVGDNRNGRIQYARYDSDLAGDISGVSLGSSSGITALNTTQVNELINDGTMALPANYLIIKNGSDYVDSFIVDPNMSINELFAKLAEYDITGTMENSIISLNSESGNYIAGDIAGLLGVDAITVGTIGILSTSTIKVSNAGVISYATESTTLGELGYTNQNSSNQAASAGASGFIEDVVQISETDAISQGYTIIKTAEDLKNISSNVSGKYILMNDIDLSGVSWSAINSFSGELNGNGYSIKNLTLSSSGTYYLGLFGYTSSGAVIKNLGLEDVNVSGYRGVGALVGSVSSTTTISNVYMTGTVKASNSVVGGLVGYSNYLTIENSYAAGDVIGVSSTGGLIGDATRTTIRNSYTSGDVTSSNSYVGGIAGSAGTVSISGTYATGNISGYDRVGGLVGSTHSITITDSFTTGNIDGRNYIGGLTGYSDRTLNVSNTYAIGNVSGSTSVGGLAGFVYNGAYYTISNSFTNANNVTGSISNSSTSTLYSNVYYNPSNKVSASAETNTAAIAATSDEIREMFITANNRPSFDLILSGGGANSYDFINLDSSTTIGEIFQILSDYGFTGSITNGVITLESADNNVIQGDILDILDLNTVVVNTTEGISATSSSAVTVNNTVTSGATLASLGVAASNTSAFQVSIDNESASGFIEGVTRLSESEAASQGYTIIKTADELQAIKNNLSGKYILMNNINLNGYDWVAIANFKGELNGNGYTINNLKIDSESNLQGLFASTQAGVKITNLGLENVNVKGGSSVGALIGSVVGSATVSNVYANGKVEGSSYVGGLIGDAYNATLTVSSTNADVDVTATGSYVGGLISYANGRITIKDSYTTGDVIGYGDIGGLLGSGRSVMVTNTYATGDIKSISGNEVGGLIGNLDIGTVKNSYTTGNITARSSNYVGGLIGNADDVKLSYVYSTGDVYGNQYVGGLLGRNDGTIDNSYTSADIFASSYYDAISYSGTVRSSLTTGTVNNVETIRYYNSYGSIGTIADTGTLVNGLNDGTYSLMSNNLLIMNKNDVVGSIKIGSNTTIAQLMNELAKYDIDVTLEDGYLSFDSPEGNYIAGSAAAQLGISVSSVNDFNHIGNTDSKRLETSGTSNANENTALKDFGIVNDNYVTVIQNGTEKVITLNSENTIGDLISALEQAGVTASISGGKLTVTGNENSYIKGISKDLENALKIYSGNGYTYESEYSNSYTSRNVITSGLDADSRFGNIGMGADNYITVVQNNTEKIVTIMTSNTVNDMIAALKDLGINVLYENGELTFEGSNYISGMTDELKSILNMQVGDGYTYTADSNYINKISDKLEFTGTFTLSETSTLSGLGISDETVMEISQNGVSQSVTFKQNATIGNVISELSKYGISAYVQDGLLTIESVGSNYVLSVSPDFAKALNIKVGSGNSYTNGTSFVNTMNTQYIDSSYTTTVNQTATFYSLGMESNNYITVISNNTQYVLTVKQSTTVDEMLSGLRQLGLSTSITNGIIKINGNENSYIKGMTDELQNILKMRSGNNYTYITGESFLNTDSKTQNKQDITTINTRTSLSSIGLSSDGYFTVISDGVQTVVTIKTDDTVSNMISKLKDAGIFASLQDGKLVLEGTGTTYVKDISQNIKDILNLQAGDDITYKDGSFTINSNSELQGDISTMTVTTINTESSFADINVKGDNYITVVSNGSEHVITVFPEYTIRDMISELNQFGITASVNNGILTLEASNNAYIKDISRELKTALKLKAGENNSWITDGEKTWVNSDSDYQDYELSNLKVSGDTVLSAIDGYNNGNGRLLAHLSNGKFATITIDSTKTLDEFFDQISEYGLVGNIDSDGKVTIEGIGNTYLQAVSGGSNILTALNLGNVVENVQTVTVNTTSKAFSYVSEVAATENSILENISNNAGQSLGESDGTIVLTTTSEDSSQRITLTFSKTQSLNDVITKLREYGVNASIDSDGVFSISTNSLKDFDISGNLGNLLMGSYGKDYEVGTTNTSSVLTETTSKPMDNSSLLSEFGVTGGNILITQMGVDYTVNINTTEIQTVSDFTNLLMEYGFYSGIDSKGRLAISAIGKSHLSSIAGGSNILEIFGLEDWTLNNTTQTSNNLTTYETVLAGTTMNTKLKDLLDSEGNKLDITSGSIYVNQQGQNHLISIDAEDTLYTLANKLNQYGVKLELTYDGKLNLSSEGDGFLTTEGLDSGIASNILEKLNISGNWHTSQTSTSDTLTYVEDVDRTITAQTKLSDLQDASGNNLGITSGTFYVYSNGIRYTETITEDMTVGDFQDLMSKYRIVSSISQNGSISLSAYNNTYLAESEFADGNSNIVSKLFTDWDFSNIYTSNKLEVSKDIVKSVTEETKLSDINEGTYQAGTITVVKDGVETDILLDADDTVGDLFEKLSSYGFDCSVTSNGQIVISNDENYTIKDSSGSNIFDIAGIDSSGWNQDNSYVTGDLSSVKISTLDAAATKDTLLSLFGVSTGEYYIYNNGVRYTAFISSDETIGSLLDTLKSFGLETSFVQTDTGSALKILGNGNSYIAKSNSVTDASNIVEKLFTDKVNTKYEYSGLVQTSEVKTALVSATEETLLSDFDLNWGDSILTAAGRLSIDINGVESVIEISSDETFGSLINKLQALGVDASISNGVFKIQSGFDTITINPDETTSNILVTLGLAYKDDLGGYLTSDRTLEATTTTVEEKTLSVANYAGMDTTLESLNISDGSLSIYRNGQKAIIQINSDETFGELRARLASAYSDLDLEFKDGYLRIYSKEKDVQLEIGSTTDTTNLLAITGLAKNEDGDILSARELYSVNTDSIITESGLFRFGDVTEGTFVIGNATFTITDKTTISDLISQINSNEESNATAYWDNIQGKFVIKSRSTGAAYINIEAGTSNFTDILGFTSSEWDSADGSLDVTRMNISSQEVGSNARFSINGTAYTSASNTVTSDVSRIKGLTINLNGLTEGSAVTLTVERDKETLASAISDVVDSYNELMKNVDEAISSEGELHGETTLKLLRNQLRSYMTSSDLGATVFKNLSAIGISVSDASANNISTTTESIINLTFDKEAFLDAYDADEDAVKALLIGSSNNTGIFTKVENLLESSLQSVGGYFASAESSYKREISRIDTKIVNATKDIERYRERLENKFASMDLLIANMQQQYSSFLV